ncbi:MAG: DUF488 domain-containing protein, partial [Desulfuromonadaceae bacterium]|nr:DUF488 domain-containing protein [Desulfuromonadaceae bacterium]
ADWHGGGFMQIQTKRAYESPAPEDGYRVLVDRLWPRGVSKQKLAVDEWNKEIAPSTELRKWFNHDPEKWGQFRERYLAELRENQLGKELLKAVKQKRLTLVYGARDTEHNQALVLQEYLEECL